MVKRVIAAYTSTPARINPNPAPSLSLNSAFSLNKPEPMSLSCLETPDNLKIDAKFMITPSSPSYVKNTASGSILYEHLPVFHFFWPPPLSDHTESIPSVLTMFFSYSLSLASDGEGEWEVA